ncbi:hypothetical protein OF83DRAFT_132135 [Amylostereum chailletii]|nr:hypothetical protein OF83DRAFT_132135 [Amylostereum chailletii]
MGTISRNDREGIAGLHAAAAGIVPSPNLRDASGTSRGVWRQKPTRIQIPSNNPPRLDHHTPGKSLNPFAGRLSSNLTKPNKDSVPKTPHGRAGNVNAGRVPVPMQTYHLPDTRPAKRHKPDTSQGMVSKHFSKPSHSRSPPPASIVISSDDDHLSSRDPLDIMRAASPEIPDYTFNSDEVQETSDPFARQGTLTVKDGPNTKRVFSQLDRAQEQGFTRRQETTRSASEEDGVDPICPPPGTGPSRSVPYANTEGRVKAMTKRYEAKNQPAPSASARAVPVRLLPGVKNSMRSKNGVPARKALKFSKVTNGSPDVHAPTPYDDIATGPSDFTRGGRKNLPVTDSVVIDLPLCAWGVGLHLKREEDGAQSKLRLHKSKSRLTLVHHTNSPNSLDVLNVKLIKGTSFTMVKHSDRKSPRNHPLIQMVVSDESFCDGPMVEHLCASGRRKEITLKFDLKHRDWDDEVYKALADHIAGCARQREVLPLTAPDRVWEMTTNAADAAEFQWSKNSHDGMAESSGRRSSVDSSELGSRRQTKSRASTPRFGPPLRRSGRKSAPDAYSTPEDLSPIVVPDGDEVVLVYPPTGKGAVNITNGDIARLRPGEFLNDTLIEFGLKLWLDELRESDPGLADQVHVFSSFFYKKYAIKNLEEGYKSVRKWTSKIDIFQKGFIIVPINEHLHWYLAIIYQPEHTLLLPSPDKIEGPSRKSMRLTGSQAEHTMKTPPQAAFSLIPESTAPDVELDRAPSALGAIVEGGDARQRSISIVPESPQADRESTAERGDERDVEDMITGFSEHSVSQPELVQDLAPSGAATQASSEPGIEAHVIEPEDVDMEGALQYPSSECDADGDVQMTNGNSPREVDSGTEAGPSSSSTVEPPSAPTTKQSSSLPPSPMELLSSSPEGPTKNPAEVPVSTFYGTGPSKMSEKAKGKQKAVPPADFDVPLTAGDEPQVLNISDDDTPPTASVVRPVPYIFTFDSLGSNHPAVGKKLATYLQMEAKDKKDLEKDSITAAEAKQAHVGIL